MCVCTSYCATEHLNALLFASTSPPSLLHFIKDTLQPGNVSDSVLTKARAKVYSVIAGYIQRAGPRVVAHVPAIVDTFLPALQLETSALCGVAVLDPLKMLVRSRHVDAQTLKMQAVLDVLMNMIRIPGKRSPSVRGGYGFSFGGFVLCFSFSFHLTRRLPPPPKAPCLLSLVKCCGAFLP